MHYQRWRVHGDVSVVKIKSKGTEFCTVTECGKPHNAKGYCDRHYRKFLKYGDPLATRPTLQDELLNRAQSNGPKCVQWKRYKDSKGYGRVRIDGTVKAAHRHVWELVHGPIPKNLFVDHICHNPSCINVSHLRLATSEENAQNRSGVRSQSRTGFRGVSRRGDRYIARVGYQGQRIHLGCYASPEEASEVAEAARIKLFGEYSGPPSSSPIRD